MGPCVTRGCSRRLPHVAGLRLARRPAKRVHVSRRPPSRWLAGRPIGPSWMPSGESLICRGKPVAGTGDSAEATTPVSRNERPYGRSNARGEDSNPQLQGQNLPCCRLHHPRMGRRHRNRRGPFGPPGQRRPRPAPRGGASLGARRHWPRRSGPQPASRAIAASSRSSVRARPSTSSDSNNGSPDAAPERSHPDRGLHLAELAAPFLAER